MQGFGRWRSLEGQEFSLLQTTAILNGSFWCSLSTYQTGSVVAKQKVRGDRRQLDKGMQEVLELLPILWRKASKTNSKQGKHCQRTAVCAKLSPQWHKPRWLTQPEKPASFCSWKLLSKSILSYNRTQTGDEGECYAVVWGLQKHRVMNNTNETWNNALGPRSEGCYGEWNHRRWSREKSGPSYSQVTIRVRWGLLVMSTW